MRSREEGLEQGREVTEKGAKEQSQQESHHVGARMRTKEEGRKEEGEGKEVSGKEENHERKEQPSLEEISKLRQIAQQNSLETLRAAEVQYEKAKDSVSQGLSAAKDTVLEKVGLRLNMPQRRRSASKGRCPRERGEGGYCKGGHFGNWKEFEYAEKAAVDLKDKAAAAGWTAAHYSTEKTVEGTKAAARAVKGAADYLSTDTESLVYQGDEKQAGELQVEETKTEEVEEEGKPSENVIQETFQGTQEQGQRRRQRRVLGAIGETIVEMHSKRNSLLSGNPGLEQSRRGRPTSLVQLSMAGNKRTRRKRSESQHE
ncbi:Seed biotin-containing protein SBP65 [Morella rubra]|uniref:Seed biotin-containing protein SBP65 n=1 Tax=Morella rubra TaxID=262757 RepID=A0A6A1VKN0_9ROSI|nr:Seed biotin-containing protein SBP65 [Morella rubra]